MGKFAENLNLGKRVLSPPPRKSLSLKQRLRVFHFTRCECFKNSDIWKFKFATQMGMSAIVAEW